MGSRFRCGLGDCLFWDRLKRLIWIYEPSPAGSLSRPFLPHAHVGLEHLPPQLLTDTRRTWQPFVPEFCTTHDQPTFQALCLLHSEPTHVNCSWLTSVQRRFWSAAGEMAKDPSQLRASQTKLQNCNFNLKHSNVCFGWCCPRSPRLSAASVCWPLRDRKTGDWGVIRGYNPLDPLRY